MLDDAELDDLRSDLVDTFPSVGFVRRLTTARDAGGGSTNAFTRVLDDGLPVAVPCRVWNALTQRDMDERTVAAKPAGVATWRILVPVGTDVGPADQLDVDGKVYEVVNGDGGRSEGFAVLLICKVIA